MNINDFKKRKISYRNVFLEEALTGFSNVRVLLSTFSYSYGVQFSREKRKVGERCASPNATSFSNSFKIARS